MEAKLRYRVAARFDDVLDVETWVSRATRASVWFEAVIRRGETVVNESSVRVACASFADGTIRRIPDALLDASLDAGTGSSRRSVTTASARRSRASAGSCSD